MSLFTTKLLNTLRDRSPHMRHLAFKRGGPVASYEAFRTRYVETHYPFALAT
jgi:hypothetical protein